MPVALSGHSCRGVRKVKPSKCELRPLKNIPNGWMGSGVRIPTRTLIYNMKKLAIDFFKPETGKWYCDGTLEGDNLDGIHSFDTRKIVALIRLKFPSLILFPFVFKFTTAEGTFNSYIIFPNDLI